MKKNGETTGRIAESLGISRRSVFWALAKRLQSGVLMAPMAGRTASFEVRVVMELMAKKQSIEAWPE